MLSVEGRVPVDLVDAVGPGALYSHREFSRGKSHPLFIQQAGGIGGSASSVGEVNSYAERMRDLIPSAPFSQLRSAFGEVRAEIDQIQRWRASHGGQRAFASLWGNLEGSGTEAIDTACDAMEIFWHQRSAAFQDLEYNVMLALADPDRLSHLLGLFFHTGEGRRISYAQAAELLRLQKEWNEDPKLGQYLRGVHFLDIQTRSALGGAQEVNGAASELEVAKGYARHGYSVHSIPRKAGQRSCDFLARKGEGAVLIEVKSSISVALEDLQARVREGAAQLHLTRRDFKRRGLATTFRITPDFKLVIAFVVLRSALTTPHSDGRGTVAEYLMGVRDDLLATADKFGDPIDIVGFVFAADPHQLSSERRETQLRRNGSDVRLKSFAQSDAGNGHESWVDVDLLGRLAAPASLEAWMMEQGYVEGETLEAIDLRAFQEALQMQKEHFLSAAYDALAAHEAERLKAFQRAASHFWALQEKLHQLLLLRRAHALMGERRRALERLPADDGQITRVLHDGQRAFPRAEVRVRNIRTVTNALRRISWKYRRVLEEVQESSNIR